MDEEMDSGLFNISLSDSEGSQAEEKADRNAQSEAAFQKVKSGFRPKIENGEVRRSILRFCQRFLALFFFLSSIRDSRYFWPSWGVQIWKTVSLPLGPSVSKPQAQELLHAVEELYFFRRYGDAAAFIRSVLDEQQGTSNGLDEETRNLLTYYETKCKAKAKLKS